MARAHRRRPRAQRVRDDGTAPGQRLGSRDDADTCRAPRRRLGRARAQVVHHRRGSRAAFHPDRETGEDPRKGLSAFMFDRDQPGWRIVRRIPIMGPEEHGGHCEIEFDGLVIPDEDRLMEIGDGLKLTQIRLGTARLTHCMRWLGLAKRSLAIALDYVSMRENHGRKLADPRQRAGHARRRRDADRDRPSSHHARRGEARCRRYARKEISMAKIVVADALHRAADVGIQSERRARILQGHGARVDLPLCAPGSPRRRRLGGAQGRARAVT